MQHTQRWPPRSRGHQVMRGWQAVSMQQRAVHVPRTGVVIGHGLERKDSMLCAHSFAHTWLSLVFDPNRRTSSALVSLTTYLWSTAATGHDLRQ